MVARGDILLVNFGNPTGSEQGGVRPAIVVQNDKGNKYSPTVQVAPITSKMKKRIPTHINIGRDCDERLIGSRVGLSAVQNTP